MQDRLKFRVWEKDQKIMKECTQITLDKDQTGSMCDVKGKVTAHLIYQPHYIIMQCTGLKDKKGKLIYEGDIVQFKISGNLTKAVVSYDKDYGEYRKGNFASLGSYQSSTEVIGNIYENEDLLNAT